MTPRTDGRSDLYILLAVFLISWITASLYLPAFRAGGGHAQFYQEEFGAAVMSACGHGYVAPGPNPPPSLTAFLEQRAATFDCADLPPQAATGSLSIMQAAYRYLMMTAALVWRVTGVSWKAIDIVLSAFFATSLAVGFVVLRLVAGRTLSIAGALLWLSSPMHLSNLPHLRDYSKTPFFVLTLLAMAFAVRLRRPWHMLLLGAVFGLVQGIGFGMRTDVILNFVPFLIALFFLGMRAVREQLPAKTGAAVLALAVFTAVGWPILTAYGGSEGLSHVALLGLTSPFDGPLGIRPAPYDFGYLYSDSFVSAEVHGDAARRQRDATSGAEPAYADASRALYITLATTFPGDFATRMTGSVMRTLNVPFSITYGEVPSGITNRFLVFLGSWRAKLILAFIGAGPLIALLVLFGISVSSLKDGATAFVLLIFWTAYPFIQFHGRHVFHLEFFVISLLVALLSLVGSGAWRIAHADRPSPAQIGKAAALVVVLVAASILVVLGARAVQSLTAQRLLSRYADAATEPLEAGALFEPPGGGLRVQQAMVSVDVHAGACDKPPATVTLRYQGDREGDFSREVRIATAPGRTPTRVFAPVYAMDMPGRESPRFTGVEVPPASAGCVHVSRVRGIDELVWVDAALAPGWQRQPLNQRVDLGIAFPERIWLKIARWWPSFAALG